MGVPHKLAYQFIRQEMVKNGQRGVKKVSRKHHSLFIRHPILAISRLIAGIMSTEGISWLITLWKNLILS